jgi:hypothetical protein
MIALGIATTSALIVRVHWIVICADRGAGSRGELPAEALVANEVGVSPSESTKAVFDFGSELFAKRTESWACAT